MIDFVTRDACGEYIVATEADILHQMRKAVPHKILIPAPAYEDNICACSECPYMKMNTMEKLYDCLLLEKSGIEVNENTRIRAAKALDRMLAL